MSPTKNPKRQLATPDNDILKVVGEIYFRQINSILRRAKNDAELLEAIVNAPFHDRIRTTQLDLGIIVLLLVNKRDGTIDRIALSDTEQAAGAVKMSEKPFKEIRIPMGYEGNAIVEAVQSGEYQKVSDWKYLFVPALSARAARFNQAGAGIEFSCVHPLGARDGGALIFSFYQISTNLAANHYNFMDKYARLADKYLAAGIPREKK